jgi:hypothetical protein
MRGLPAAGPFLAAALLLAGCGAPSPGPAPTESPAPAEHLLEDLRLAAGETVSWGRDVQVHGARAVTIPAGATLSIRADVRPATASSWLAVAVEDGGRLEAAGATLVAVRVTLAPGADAALRSSTLDQRAGGIAAANATLLLDAVTLDGSPESALSLQGGRARLRATWFLASGGQQPALDLIGAAVAMDGGGFGGSASYGVQAVRSALWMNGTTIGATADYGLHASGSTLALRGNTWRPFCAMFLVDGTSGTVDGDRFEARDRAVTLGSAGPLAIRGARFAAAPSVVRATNATLTVEDSVLEGGVATLDGSRASWTGNALGATLVEATGPGDVALHNNSWPAGTALAVRGSGGARVDATWNWWGDAQGPGRRIEGPVAADPWLREPPRAG